MMENGLTAVDINSHAVRATGAALRGVAPLNGSTAARCLQFPYGVTGDVDDNGRPVVVAGSLELLDEPVIGNQGLVAMNPPVTRQLSAARETEVAMSARLKQLTEGTIADGGAGVAAMFAPLAHQRLAPGGRLALILPRAAMTARSWQKFRALLSNEYDGVVVVGIAGSGMDSAFTADTNMPEVMVVARRLRDGEPPCRLVHRVELTERPGGSLEAGKWPRPYGRRWPLSPWPERPQTPWWGDPR